MSSGEKELIFCDTFNHSESEGELHVDMVKFPGGVTLREVRVLPLDYKVPIEELNKTGQTTPSTFTLSVYINDSTNPLAPTFEPAGSIEYQSDVAVLSIKPKTPSDMLVVSGLYNALTLCVYGNPPAPPEPVEAPFAQSSSPRNRRGSSYSDSGSEYSDRNHSASPGGGSDTKEGGFDLFEPFSPVNSPDHLFDLSDDEMGGEKRSAATGYEEFSDEEITFDDEFENQDGGDPSFLYSEDAWLTSGSGFNPYQCTFTKLESYPLATETPHEALLRKSSSSEASGKRGSVDEVARLRDLFTKAKETTQAQKWVELMEELPTYLYPGLAQLERKSSSESKELMKKIGQWILQCLDMERATQLPVILNVRSVKAGLRMVPIVASLGRKCAHVIIKYGVMDTLSGLLVAEHMASSLKLLAIIALDSLTDYPQGMEQLLGWNTESIIEVETPYQVLLQLALSNPSARVMKATGALIAKAHVYELLGNLQKLVSDVISLAPPKDIPNLTDDILDPGVNKTAENAPESMETESHDTQADQLDVRMDENPGQLEEQQVLKIVNCLEELNECLLKAKYTIVQPSSKAFPTRTFCFPQSERNFYPCLMRMFHSRRLLECLAVLLSSPVTAVELRVLSAARDLLLLFMGALNSLLFLSSSPVVMATLTRVLIQTAVDSELPLSAMQPLSVCVSQEGSESCTAQNLGLLLTYHIQVLQSLDVLRRAPKTSMVDLESTETIGAMHTLYTMTLTPIGKQAVSHVLAMGDNVTSLLPFVEPWGQKDHDTKLKKSSVSSRYAAVLLLQLLQSHVRGDFLLTHGSKLLSMAEFYKDNPSPTMSDLHNWLHAVKDISTRDYNKSLSALVNLIKESTPFISFNKPGKGNSPIITSLRLILSFITPPDSNKDVQKDLKWSGGVITLFSSGVMDTFIALFDKFSEMFLPSWGQQQSLSVANAGILCTLVNLALKVVKVVLTQLLGDGDFQYRDTRIVSSLLRVHMVLCSAPLSSVVSQATPEIQALIVDVLTLYTNPGQLSLDSGTATDIMKSCWCLMLEVVFKHTLTSPHCFISGLTILSELLPLPLPVETPQDFNDSAAQFVLSSRELWVEHLAPFQSDLTAILQTFVYSGVTAVHQALRRVCGQLVDLSPGLASFITSHVIKYTVAEIKKQLEQPEPMEDGAEDKGKEKKSNNGGMVRMLTMCAVLCQQSGFKAALLQLMSSDTDTPSFPQLLLSVLKKEDTSVQANICILTVFHALCNVFVSLLPVSSADNMEEPSQVDTAESTHCLPDNALLSQITSAVFTHVTSSDQSMASVLVGLKVILCLCQHNTGLVHVYNNLSSNVVGLNQLLERIMTAISSDSLGYVSLFLELLNTLLSCQVRGLAGPEKELVSFSLPKPLVKAVIIKSSGENMLDQLKKSIEDGCKENESLLNDFLSIINVLGELFTGVPEEIVELAALDHEPAAESLSLEAQFEQRSTIVLSAAENTDDPDYWLASPPHDESQLELETVTTDLSKLASESCSGFNLEEELKKHLLPSPQRTPPQRKRKIAFSGPEAQKRLKEAMELRIKSGRSNLFRSRKQNTSRPPSMHVDDFMRADVSRGSSGFGLERGRLGAPVPYMPAGMYMPPIAEGSRLSSSNSRWVSQVPSGMSYRREVSIRPSWGDFVTSAHMKQMSSSLRWPSLQAYSRSRGVSSGRTGAMVWPGGSDPWKSSRQQYKK